MQFDMEPIGLPSPSRTYQAVQKCCHGTWWLFGMVAIGVALRIADCPLYNFCCVVETIAPKKLTWVPVFIIYIYITCMPIIPVPYAIPSHFDSSWFLQRDTSPSCRWDQLRFPTAAGSRPGACKLARQDDGICLRTCIYIYKWNSKCILHTYLRISIHRFLNVYIYIVYIYTVQYKWICFMAMCVCSSHEWIAIAGATIGICVFSPSGWISSQCCVT